MPVKKSTSKHKTSVSKKAASPKSRAASKNTRSGEAGDCEVMIDRRSQANRRDDQTSPQKVERRDKVQRRRQIDPTTCERDYSVQEVEFMNAMDQYKRTNGRMFPTCSEVLEVIRGLGYVQLTPAEMATFRPEPTEEFAPEFENGEADSDGENIECKEEMMNV